jgi:hypothetical protein
MKLVSLGLRSMAALGAVGLLCGSVVVSCSGDSDSGGGDNAANRPNSAAMGLWSPDPDYSNECTKDMHDKHFVLGPDGKKYPTWHPPSEINPATNAICYYGHEHGPDPRGYRLYAEMQQHFAFDADGNGRIDAEEIAKAGIPFGYASEQLGGAVARQPAHTAWKVVGRDSVQRDRLVNGQAQAYALKCQQIVAFNQDTHTADAFASNAHEIIYAINCDQDAEAANFAPKLIATAVAGFGAANSFELGAVGNAAPAKQTTSGGSATPTVEVATGSETPPRRYVPDLARVHERAFVAAGLNSDLTEALAERWDALVVLRTASADLARFNPSLITFDPPRYYNAGATARSVDLCYSGLNSGGQVVTDPLQTGTIVRQVRGSNACSTLQPTGPNTAVAQRIAFDTRKSTFKGCRRSVIFRDQTIVNATGPQVWYTDAYGRNASTAPFAGSVKQLVGTLNTVSRGIVLAPVELAETNNDCSEATGIHVPTP